MSDTNKTDENDNNSQLWYMDQVSEQFCPSKLYISMFITASIICIGLLSIILILTVGINNILKKSPEIDFIFKSTFWISLFCIFLWLFLWPIAIYLCQTSNDYNIHFKFAFILQISGTFFALIIRTMYILTWIKRLVYVFRDSIFDILSKTKYILYIFALFTIFIKVISFILFIISYIENDLNIKHKYDQIARSLSIFGEIMYSLLIIFIVYWFLHKLNKLLFNAANTIYQANDIDNIRLPPYQLDMIRGASRYFILSTFGLMVTIIDILVNIVLLFFVKKINLSQGFQIYYSFSLLDHYINFMMLYMQYNFGKNVFEYLCSFCDYRIRNILNHNASRKTKKSLSMDLPHSSPSVSNRFRVSVIMDKMQEKQVNHVKDLQDLVDDISDILVDPSERQKLVKKLPSHSNQVVEMSIDMHHIHVNHRNKFGDL